MSIADSVNQVGKEVAAALGAKGGGRAGRFQGKAAHITQAQVQSAMQHIRARTGTEVKAS